MARQSLRIILLARDIELRIVSLIVRAREGAAEVLLNGEDSTLIRKRETIEDIFSGCDV